MSIDLLLRLHVLAMVLLALGACHPGADNASPRDAGTDADADASAEQACADCLVPDAGGVCFKGLACTIECNNSSDCPRGHRCVDYQAAKVCDPRCDLDLCASLHSTCSWQFDGCEWVECSSKVACDGMGMLCDEYQRQCFPASGACKGDEDCPVFDMRIDRLAERVCTSGKCRIKANKVDAPTDVSPDLEINTPKDGKVFADASQAIFTWQPVSRTVIVLIMDAMPASRKEMIDHAVWGRIIAADDATHSSKWSDGQAISHGKWRAQAGSPPMGQALYLIVQAVHGDKLVRVSHIVRFAFSEKDIWPTVGTKCKVPNEIGGACDRPGLPMACLEGACRPLCLSQRDCDDFGICAPVHHGLRVCLQASRHSSVPFKKSLPPESCAITP